MTKAEKRLTDYAELVDGTLNQTSDAMKNVLIEHLKGETKKILSEFRKKEKSDGRKRKTLSKATDGEEKVTP